MKATCPHCGTENEADLIGRITIACIGCGVDFETEVQEKPQKISVQLTSSELKQIKPTKPATNSLAPTGGDNMVGKDGLEVTCHICGRGKLHYVHKSWLPGPLVTIGGIIFAISVVAIIVHIFVLCVALFGGQSRINAPGEVTLIVGLALLFPSAMSALIGMVLMAHKKHLECSVCRVLHTAG